MAISRGLRRFILKRDRYTCQACGTKFNGDSPFLHVDHIVPKARGGSDLHGNLQLLCFRCNGDKGTNDAISHGRRFEIDHAFNAAPEPLYAEIDVEV